jgi:hypothetical protein
MLAEVAAGRIQGLQKGQEDRALVGMVEPRDLLEQQIPDRAEAAEIIKVHLPPVVRAVLALSLSNIIFRFQSVHVSGKPR